MRSTSPSPLRLTPNSPIVITSEVARPMIQMSRRAPRLTSISLRPLASRVRPGAKRPICWSNCSRLLPGSSPVMRMRSVLRTVARPHGPRNS